jgi:hypothetical protein
LTSTAATRWPASRRRVEAQPHPAPTSRMRQGPGPSRSGPGTRRVRNGAPGAARSRREGGRAERPAARARPASPRRGARAGRPRGPAAARGGRSWVSRRWTPLWVANHRPSRAHRRPCASPCSGRRAIRAAPSRPRRRVSPAAVVKVSLIRFRSLDDSANAARRPGAWIDGVQLQPLGREERRPTSRPSCGGSARPARGARAPPGRGRAEIEQRARASAGTRRRQGALSRLIQKKFGKRSATQALASMNCR